MLQLVAVVVLSEIVSREENVLRRVAQVVHDRPCHLPDRAGAVGVEQGFGEAVASAAQALHQGVAEIARDLRRGSHQAVEATAVDSSQPAALGCSGCGRTRLAIDHRHLADEAVGANEIEGLGVFAVAFGDAHHALGDEVEARTGLAFTKDHFTALELEQLWFELERVDALATDALE